MLEEVGVGKDRRSKSCRAREMAWPCPRGLRRLEGGEKHEQRKRGGIGDLAVGREEGGAGTICVFLAASERECDAVGERGQRRTTPRLLPSFCLRDGSTLFT